MTAVVQAGGGGGGGGGLAVDSGAVVSVGTEGTACNRVGGMFWECLFAMDNGRCARSERQGGERGEPWGGSVVTFDVTFGQR